MWALFAALAAIGVAVGMTAWLAPSLFRMLAGDDERQLNDDHARPLAEGTPTALILAIDGVDRALLYEMLRDGELPRLAELLGGRREGDGREGGEREGGTLPHAHLDETLLAPLPTSTLTSWATLFTGEIPAVHGVAGNEYFIREERRYAGPAPVSVFAPELVLRTYADGYANDLLAVPTVYERMRDADPRFTAWVSMSHFYRGADMLLLADRTVVAEAFGALLSHTADGFDLYATLDREVVETLTEALEDDPLPQLLTVYLTGADLYAHGSPDGPDPARRRYLREVVDEVVGELARVLDERGSTEHRYVIVLSDHGHSEVGHDDQYALGMDDENDPPEVVATAGYRLRPFEVEVDDSHDYNAVLVYGGAMAYAYVADRSSCPEPGMRCDWSRPPRFDEDVVPLAEAFHAASPRGEGVPALRDALDMVLVRPRVGEPMEVYLGDGRTTPIRAHLEEHARPSYVEFEERLRDLTIGPKGHHAGDIILLANNGNEAVREHRYYFAGLYHSWHGSPSRQDSEIPLILAHPRRTSRELAALVRDATGARTDATEIVALLEAILRDES